MLETASKRSFCAFVSVKNQFFKESDTDFPFSWNNKPDEMIMNIEFGSPLRICVIEDLNFLICSEQTDRTSTHHYFSVFQLWQRMTKLPS